MFITFESESDLPPCEAVAALVANVSRPRWFRHPTTPFIGRVWDSGFRLIRVVHGRDSFNPMLYGQLSPSPKGTHVRVIMTLHPVVWAFMAIWSGFLGHAYLSEGKQEILVLAFLLFPWVLAACFFPYGVRASKDLLRKCLRLHTNQ